jgi:hypothetical protein
VPFNSVFPKVRSFRDLLSAINRLMYPSMRLPAAFGAYGMYLYLVEKAWVRRKWYGTRSASCLALEHIRKLGLPSNGGCDEWDFSGGSLRISKRFFKVPGAMNPLFSV